MEFRTTFNSPVGKILIIESDNSIVGVHFYDNAEFCDDTPLLRETIKQLDEYFRGSRREFSVPLRAKGSEFQQSVWQALTDIPFGETRSYGEIARAVGNPKASRAVGMANNKNPIGIIVPCHRVIGANGKLVGYAGGLDKKSYLLQMEKNYLLKEDSCR